MTTKRPPGPRGFPAVGIFPMLRRRPVDFLLESVARYGDALSLPLGVRRAYLFSHPDHVKQILQDADHVYRKEPTATRVRLLFGDSLTTIDGDPWRRRRRLMRPAFHHQRLAALGPGITEATSGMLDRWDDLARHGRPVDVLDEMAGLTRAVTLRAIFGAVTAEDARALGRALDVALHHVDACLWRMVDWGGRLPAPGARRCARALGVLDAFVRRRLDETRLRSPSPAGVAAALLQPPDEPTRGAASDDVLRQELRALLFAGHTTTASALAWIWYLLAQHPETDRALREELAAVLSDRPPTIEDLAALGYTRRVIDEALRLYPPTWLTGRVPVVDTVVGGYRVPAHALVLLSPFVTHRHPGFWTEPARFDPARFTPERSAGRPRFAYFPFGGGERACIGSGLALMEMQMIVATVAQRYRLELAAERPLEIEAGVTLRPRHGLPMTLHRAGPIGAR